MRTVDQGLVLRTGCDRLEFDCLTERASHQFRKAANELTYVCPTGVERLAAAKGQKLSCQPRAVLSGILGFSKQTSNAFVAEHAFCHFKVAADDSEKVIEVVRQTAGQLTNRFHFLRLAQLLLYFLPACQVADKSGKNTIAVGNRLTYRQLHRKT
ncbi:hypothetical protein D3C87_1483660 [compost metagenome]